MDEIDSTPRPTDDAPTDPAPVTGPPPPAPSPPAPSPATDDVVIVPTVAATRPQLSLWAFAAFCCSLIMCFPPMPLIAPILALFGLREVRRRPDRSGRGLARAALVISGVALVLYVGLAWAWHVTVRRPVLDGPLPALRAGVDDPAALASAFGRPESADEARVFMRELVRRYGDIQSISAPAAAPTREIAVAMNAAVPGGLVMAYEIEFDRGGRAAYASFLLTDPSGWPPRATWGWLVILDPVAGDLLYPASSSGEVSRVLAASSPAVTEGEQP
ncbi:MAG: DUF4190 domain-containing protein [Phycisphaerales bacterium]|nr:DUF4190 domain-containing protein [Phycisphaerales bacterium]